MLVAKIRSFVKFTLARLVLCTLTLSWKRIMAFLSSWRVGIGFGIEVFSKLFYLYTNDESIYFYTESIQHSFANFDTS